MLRLSISRVAARYLAAREGSCEGEHSWAWITPEGKFIEVGDHGGWAMKNFPDETYALSRQRPPEDFSFTWGSKLFRAFLHMSIYDTDKFAEGPPPELLQRGSVYKIPEIARKQAEARGLPTLSQGTWPLRTKLTPAEERFLENLEVFPEIVPVDQDNRWNRRVRDAWRNSVSSFLLIPRSDANKVLMEAGWVTVANAYALGVQRALKPPQWETFFREVLKCWKASGIRPPVEREVMFLTIANSSYEKMTYADAIDRYCPRLLQDEIYEYLLEGRPSATSLERYELRREQERERTPDVEIIRAPYVSSPEAQAPLREKERKKRYPDRPSRRRLAQAWLELS